MGVQSTHNLCFEKKYEKYQNFYLIFFPFLVVNFSIYLNRRIFVMVIRLRSSIGLLLLAHGVRVLYQLWASHMMLKVRKLPPEQRGPRSACTDVQSGLSILCSSTYSTVFHYENTPIQIY